MKVTNHGGSVFTLEGQDDADQALLDDIDLGGGIKIMNLLRTTKRAYHGGYEITAVRLSVGAPRSVGDALSKGCGCLCKLNGLAPGDAAQHGHVGGTATNPQAHESFSACLEQLQIVAQALGDVVGKLELVLKEVRGTHDGHPLVIRDAAIVAQGGAA